MVLENWNLNWGISRRMPNSPPTNLGLSFGAVNCLVVFPTYWNPNNSPLIILEISLLFMYTPALRGAVKTQGPCPCQRNNWSVAAIPSGPVAVVENTRPRTMPLAMIIIIHWFPLLSFVGVRLWFGALWEKSSTKMNWKFLNSLFYCAVASWLVRSIPERAVWVRALAGDIVLCSCAPSTQVYKWVPAN